MDHLSRRQTVLLDITGRLYAAAFYTTYKRFLGWRLSTWLHLVPLVLALVLLFQRRPILALVALALFVLFRLAYWLIRRRGYKSFIADPDDRLPPDTPSIANNKHIPVRATGIFAVTDREAYLLERSPTEYWRAPLGEHIVMARQAPQRFLYQFFKGDTLIDVTPGWLIAAGRARRALAIRFYVTWGPEFIDNSLLFIVGGGQKNLRGKARTLYFSVDDEGLRYQIWQTLAKDIAAARDEGTIEG